MAEDSLKSFFVNLGWRVDESSKAKAEKSVADHEKIVREAEKRVEAARRAAAATTKQTDEQMARDDLRAAQEALRAAKEVEAAAEKVARAKQKEAKESAEAIAFAITKLNLFVDAAISAGTKIGSAIGGAVTGLDQLYYVGKRTGTSVESIKNLGHAFSQVGGSMGQAVSALESFAKGMRTNEGLAGFVKDLGVDTKKDKVLQLLDVVDRLKKEGYQVGSQQAEMLGIPEDAFNLMVQQGDQIKRFYAERAKAVKDFGVDEKKASEASARLMQGLNSLAANGEVAFEKLVTAAIPRLLAWIENLKDWVHTHQKEIGAFLEWIAEKAEWVGNKITDFVEAMAGSLQDKEKQKAFQEWKDGFTAIGHAAQRVLDISEKLANSKLWTVLKALTVDNPLANWPLRLLASTIGGAEASTGGPGAHAGPAGSTPPDDRTFWERNAPKALGGKDAPAAGDGSRSWRNSNPGNIKDGPFARAHGAVGADDKGFARFPSYEAGRKAQEALLFDSAGYKGMTIRQAIARWAPGSDGNDPAGYAQQMAQATGAGVDTKLSDLSPEQRAKFLDAQQRKEGWTPGGGGVQVAGNTASVNGSGGVDQRQGNAQHRRQPISAELNQQLKIAGLESGTNVEIFSGGQSEDGPDHFGSHRHDHGGSADLKLYTIGADGKKRYLSMKNDADRALMGTFIRAAVAAGANGVGAALDYMGEHGIHVGGGSPAAWGAKGASANVPDWVRRAHQLGMKDRAGSTAPASAPAPPVVPGGRVGFESDALTRPAAPLATGTISTSNTSNARTLNQTNNYNVDIKDSRGPEAHAKVFKDTTNQMGQLHLENAQRAFG